MGRDLDHNGRQNQMIREVIITTSDQQGAGHIAPMGIWQERQLIVIAPFKPSLTLDNIQRHKSATVNYIDDVRIFAGCLTGRKDWSLMPTEKIDGYRLTAALSHVELELSDFEDDPLRPRCYCQPIYEAAHRPFTGFNRAQAAVLEAAILVSRLHLLTDNKIDREIKYLTTAIDKTAGENETIAWNWLMDEIKTVRQRCRDKTA